MKTFEVRKSWPEKKYRICSVSVTLEAESEKKAIERAYELLKGVRPTRKREWEWGDDTVMTQSEAAAEEDWDSEAAATQAEWQAEEV